jgi:valyl-tRNA synthetase
MTTELPSRYTPADIEPRITRKWLDAKAFHAQPTDAGDPYCIVIPPPNVTAALHLGHALNNTLQDILVRWHRMMGFNTLWMPGTDHAGIATQTVVEKRVLAEEGKRRTDFDRDAFVARIQAWKDEYEQVILGQLKAMGCSCDWDRTRFTMDEQCAKAVREAFFQLFKDGLIYRGKRLVNWDPVTQTALADDEVENEEIDGHFYYMKYPLVEAPHANAGLGYVTVATTRPETMLGDTAVAVNPRDSRAPALKGKFVKLPIVGRVIPIIEDDYVVLPNPDSDDAKAKYATGFLKVTPAHDPNDYEIGQRHNLPIINVFSPTAAISKDHGWPAEEWERAGTSPPPAADAEFLLGMDRYEARKAIVEWFRQEKLLEDVKPYRHTVGHSYRSHVPIEPYLSDQWYVKVTDAKLSGAALRALSDCKAATSGRAEQSHATDAQARPMVAASHHWEGRLRFIPERYANTYRQWNENIRDWCISRQLWWGHRIPVFTAVVFAPTDQDLDSFICEYLQKANVLHKTCIRRFDGSQILFVASLDEESDAALLFLNRFIDRYTDDYVYSDRVERGQIEDMGFNFDHTIPVIERWRVHTGFVVQDPDVLDTWFSSGLWPISTMGWPTATPELQTWNPSSVLCTAREIITLWVSRMVMFNIYFRGCLPFTDVFIHAMIQDGEGRKMSKSLGNGVDPMDIIHSHGADAMRFTLAQMTTQTQDVRLPVEKTASGGNTSPRFDGGRNFANKLWNAVRFAMTSLSPRERVDASSRPGEGGPGRQQNSMRTGTSDVPSPQPSPGGRGSQSIADRWILSRTARAIDDVTAALRAYDFHNYANRLYQFVWNDFCDWYLEAIKPTIKESPQQQAVLREVLSVILRLLHPVMPFITEALWEALSDDSQLLARAPWPKAETLQIDAQVEEEFDRLQTLVTMIREVRTQTQTPPRETVEVSVKIDSSVASRLKPHAPLLERLANVTITRMGPDVIKPDNAAVVVRPLGEAYLHRQLDVAAERQRLAKQIAVTNKSIAALEGRLNNTGYTDKAPPHLVQQTRDELAGKQQELAALEAQLSSLG